MGLCWLLGLLVLLLLSQAKVVAFAALFVCALAALAFPCFVSGLLALPLCGAAPTFLCMPQRKATVLEVKREAFLGRWISAGFPVGYRRAQATRMIAFMRSIQAKLYRRLIR